MKARHWSWRLTICFAASAMSAHLCAQPLTTAGEPAILEVRVAGAHSVRVTLRPASDTVSLPFSPGVAARDYPAPGLSLRALDGTVKRKVGALDITVSSEPLTIL